MSNAPRILADGHHHDSPTQSNMHPGFYTTKVKINTGVVDRVLLCGRWPGAGFSGSSEVARGSRVRLRHAPDSPSSLSRILIRSGTFHSLYAHTLTQSVGCDARLFAKGCARRQVRASGRAVRYWGRRRRAWWLYRGVWRHYGDVTDATSLTVPPTDRLPPPAATATTAARPSLR